MDGSDHPTAGSLRRFLRGTVPPGKRACLLAHLLRCEPCWRQVEPSFQSRPASSEAAAAAAADPAYDGALDKAFSVALRRERTLTREREAAVPVVAAVLAGQRRLRDLTEEEAERLRGLPLIDLLLDRSRALRHSDPAGMIQLAELARLAVEHLEGHRYGHRLIADLRARTWGELGNAYRVADDLDAAERALANGVAWWGRGSADPLLAARLGDLLASLYSDQRRFSEAIDALNRVQAVYKSQGDDHLAGRALISQGVFTGYSGQPGRAIALICEGMDLVDLEREPELELLSAHNLVLSMVDCGRYRQARIILWRSRPLYFVGADPLTLLRLRWVEGKIYAGLTDFERAESAYQETRQGFQKVGQTYDAALASLDLALVWVLQGRREEVAVLATQLIATFRAHRIAREAIAALLLTRDWCHRWWVPDDVLYDKIEAVAMLLRELERQPSRRQPRRRR